MIVRGVVTKLELEPRIRSLWLRRNEGILLESEEWEWDEDQSAAFVFPTFELAEEAATRLRGNGERHVSPVVFGSGSVDGRAVNRAMEIPGDPLGRLAVSEERAGREAAVRRHQQILERMHLD